MKRFNFQYKVAATTFIVVVLAVALQSLARSVSIAIVSADESVISVFLPQFVQIVQGVIPIVIILSAYLFISLRPLRQVITAIERDEPVSESARVRARRLIGRLPVGLIIGNVLGFTLGILVSIFSDPSSLLRMEGLLQLLSFAALGIVLASVQIGIDEMILGEPRRLLGIYDLENMSGYRYVSIFRRRAVVLVSLVVMLMTFLALTGLEAVQTFGDTGIDVDRVGIAMTAVILYGVVLAAVVVYTTSLGERSQINAMCDRLETLAAGNASLNAAIPITQYDEIGVMTSHMNRIIGRQEEVMANIRAAADRVVQSSGEVEGVIEQTRTATERLSSSIEQVNAKAEENMQSVNNTGSNLKDMLDSVDQITEQVDSQASNVEQSSSAVHELAESVRNVSSTTDRANELAGQADRVAREGGEAVKASLQSIHDIESASEQVNSIISVISKISAQTNMLAMNAAIEAAHAGDAGRGFAVVAEEVRSLAADSAGSAREISDHIKQMRSQVETGVAKAEEAGKSLDRIQNDIAQTSELIAEIASAMREQNSGTDELLSGITALVESTESIRAVASEQKERNNAMRTSLDELLESFSEIQTAAHEQTDGTREIVQSFNRLREVARENASVVEQLQAVSGSRSA
ncbi:MAG: methyl-accepting chemotaxis protein [Spirochaetales bacterium]